MGGAVPRSASSSWASWGPGARCTLHAARRSGQEGRRQAGPGVYPGTPVTAGTAQTRMRTRYNISILAGTMRIAYSTRHLQHPNPAPQPSTQHCPTWVPGYGSTSPGRRHLAPLFWYAQQPQPNKSGARGQKCPGDGGDGDDGAGR